MTIPGLRPGGLSPGLKNMPPAYFLPRFARPPSSSPITHQIPYKKESSKCYSLFYGVGNGTRTHNARNHNPVLCQLNYTHHIKLARQEGFVCFSASRKVMFGSAQPSPATLIRVAFYCSNPLHRSAFKLARQEGFEPPTYCLEGSCSILLSYWRISMERVTGIGPAYPAWKAGVLPLNYTRAFGPGCLQP